jgi:SAM-dependent MidA family methyltransferase
MQNFEPAAVTTSTSTLLRLIHSAIARNSGWLPFDRYMALALYAPGAGYYARGSRQFGLTPASGSDFVTAPELSPLFGQTLAHAVAQALRASGTAEIWEFGAGSGALAEQLLQTLGEQVERYTVVDLSGTLRERQQERLMPYGNRVQWVSELPTAMQGVIVGNEVLDAMPVQLLHFDGSQWLERGVVSAGTEFAWSDRPTALQPPLETLQSENAWSAGYVTEIHPQAEAFVSTLAERLTRGAAFFIDYGFPEAEYYHTQRTEGTLMCHRAHRCDTDPLTDVGLKDITAHINFTAIALAAQNAGLDVLGYTSQAHFLFNCGVMEALKNADFKTIANTQKLFTEHEMGELFKVIGFTKNCDTLFTHEALGFTHGDRTHTL